MAGDGDTDMKAHVASYDRMIGMLKWGAIACVVIVAAVIWLIVS